MRILGQVLVFIFTMAFAMVGALLVAFSFNPITVQNLIELLVDILHIQNINLFVGGIGLFLIIASIFIAQITLGKMQREKTIAFNNPDGQVTVSLSAIEDFIRRLSTTLSEIKDLRSNVIAGKKAIEITCRVSLWADANIPETTENIQAIIKNRLQEMLGIEEPIVVRVHVGKIVEKERIRPKNKEKKETAEEITPFRGDIKYGND